METRLIKTCHGLREVRFHDGALVLPGVEPIEMLSPAMYAWLTPAVMEKVFPTLNAAESAEVAAPCEPSKILPTTRAVYPASEPERLIAGILRWVQSFPTFESRRRR